MEEEEEPEPKPDICFKIKVAEFYPKNCSTLHVRGASKIKLKNDNKKRMATARRLIFFGISQGIHCWSDYTVFFHHYKTLKAVAKATGAIVVLTPANFYHFRRPKFNFQPLSFTFETFGKKLAKTKIVARVNVKKIKAKKKEKGLEMTCDEAATAFYQNLSITVRWSGGFLAPAEALLKFYE
jgi:hypothetical protein